MKITIHQADLSNTEQTLALCEEAAKAHGKPISILVRYDRRVFRSGASSLTRNCSNAGRGKRYPQIWDIPVEEFDLTIATNLKASFLLVKGVAEGMRDQRWGRIVFISSIAAYGAGMSTPVAHSQKAKADPSARCERSSLRSKQGWPARHDEEPEHETC